MSVGGIVLMTLFLTNALTIQAHYCPCNYNSELVAPDKYYESFLSYGNTFSPFPNDYHSNKQEPFQQSLESSFPQQYHKKTAEEPKRSEVIKPSNEAKQQDKTGKGQAYDVMRQNMNIGKGERNMNTKIVIENGRGRLERMEEKDAREQYAVEEKLKEGYLPMEQKIIPHNDQNIPPSLLIPYLSHKPIVMGPKRPQNLKPSNEAREQNVTEKKKPASELTQQIMNKDKEQSKKTTEMSSENTAVGLKRTQYNRGKITHGIEEKNTEGSSEQEQRVMYESNRRPFEIPNTGRKPATQIIIQRSPPSNFNYFSPNFIGVEIL